jgi:hypothetical protein
VIVSLVSFVSGFVSLVLGRVRRQSVRILVTVEKRVIAADVVV